MPEKKKMYTSTFTHEGKRHYVRSSKSQRDADRRADRKRAELEDGRDTITEAMPFARYADMWLQTYKLHTVTEPVYKAFESRIRVHINPAIGHLKLRDIRHSHLQKIMQAQIGKSKDHCVKMRATLQAIFAQAVRDKALRDNPAEDLTLPIASNGTHRSITETERQAIEQVAATHRFGPFVMTMLYTGMRPQEVAALEWTDIDQINHRVMVRRALKRDGSIGDTKSDAGKRDIPIPDKLWAILNQLDKSKKYIFRNTRGERLSYTSIRSGWRGFLHEVDIALGAETVVYYNFVKIVRSVIAPDLTPYCLRHTYCTDLEADGVPINVASRLMGHSKLELTARIYTHMREDTLANATTLIEDGIAKRGATAGATHQGQLREIKGTNREGNEELEDIEEVL